MLKKLCTDVLMLDAYGGSPDWLLWRSKSVENVHQDTRGVANRPCDQSHANWGRWNYNSFHGNFKWRQSMAKRQKTLVPPVIYGPKVCEDTVEDLCSEKRRQDVELVEFAWSFKPQIPADTWTTSAISRPCRKSGETRPAWQQETKFEITTFLRF